MHPARRHDFIKITIEMAPGVVQGLHIAVFLLQPVLEFLRGSRAIAENTAGALGQIHPGMGLIHGFIEGHIFIFLRFGDHAADEFFFHFPHFFMVKAQARPASGRRIGPDAGNEGLMIFIPIIILRIFLDGPIGGSVHMEQKPHIQAMLFGAIQETGNIIVIDFPFRPFAGAPKQPCADGIKAHLAHIFHIAIPLIPLRGSAPQILGAENIHRFILPCAY